MIEGDIALIVGGVIAAIVLLAGIRVIRPTHVGAIETLGRFSGFRRYGITYVFPAVQKLYKVNVTEQLVDVTKQDVITKDNLNCTVDAQVYFRVGKSDDDAQADLLKRVRDILAVDSHTVLQSLYLLNAIVTNFSASSLVFLYLVFSMTLPAWSITHAAHAFFPTSIPMYVSLISIFYHLLFYYVDKQCGCNDTSRLPAFSDNRRP